MAPGSRAEDKITPKHTSSRLAGKRLTRKGEGGPLPPPYAASWKALGQPCTCSNGDSANILQQPSAIVCGSWRTCKGVLGTRDMRSCSFLR
jgi:hypothetical protein